jgi:hypothetical protein
LQSLLDVNPTRGFLRLLSIVSRDSSVLLDFLVSNETCFLLYLLRYLKFILKVRTLRTCPEESSVVDEDPVTCNEVASYIRIRKF